MELTIEKLRAQLSLASTRNDEMYLSVRGLEDELSVAKLASSNLMSNIDIITRRLNIVCYVVIKGKIINSI